MLTQAATGVLFGFALICFGVALVWWSANRRAARREAEEALAYERLLRAQHLGAILVGSGADFEQSVRDVLIQHGYQLELVGRSGDRGVDLRGSDPAGFPVIVQCKRYGPDNRVGSPVVQLFLGAIVNHGATSGIFVTTSSFTRDALALAQQSRIPLWLIDGDQFTAMARTVAGA